MCENVLFLQVRIQVKAAPRMGRVREEGTLCNGFDAGEVGIVDE